jgi:tetratricopeptide (TPR) repeat protein
MPSPLRLTLTDYRDPAHWRWVLSDAKGGFLADHTVSLDQTTREYQGFVELGGFLDFYKEAYPPERQLEDLGDWIGEKVFGGLRAKLLKQAVKPAQPVQVLVPEAAQELLFRPFELARFANKQTFSKAGIRFIYQRDDVEAPVGDKPAATNKLRILAVFSLPVRKNPLNLRRERYEMQRFVRELNQTQGLAVELRVLQYGATRKLLEDTLQDGEGWDIVHLSGHGDKGELLLENDWGGTDAINAEDLGELLSPNAERLKLLILDACYSGAGSHAAARVQVGLDKVQTRETGAEGEPVAQTALTVLPSLAQNLAERLDCAALAMRYPVGDAFACELMLSLYDKLLDRQRPLPAALHLALDVALGSNIPQPPLSAVTPILIGGRAAELKLIPPSVSDRAPILPKTGLGIAFPDEPLRFVGRLQAMLRASQALASRSPERGVLFYGMPGAGKTACALELAYRHAEGRFQAHIWHKAPEAGSDIATALFNLFQDMQTQLNAPDLGLTTSLDDPPKFRQYTLPRLRALLQQYSLLLVLDNMENLLTESGAWRDGLWGEVLAALLSHNGPSRVVLTSRRIPSDLAEHPKLQREAIHALSFAESVLLARELPNLNALFDDADGQGLLQHTLWAVQGHPKLLELAEGLAADRTQLAERVEAAKSELAEQDTLLDQFFAVGIAKEGETRRSEPAFMRELQSWTAGVSALLPASVGLLFQVLCNLEAVDRKRDVLDHNWKDILSRLGSLSNQPPFAKGGQGGFPTGVSGEATEPLPETVVERPYSGLQPDTQAEPVGRNKPALAGVSGEVAEPMPETVVGRPYSGLQLSAALEQLARVGLLSVEASPELEPEVLAALQTQLTAQELPLSLDAILQQFRAQATTFSIHPGVAEATRGVTEPLLRAAIDQELGDYHIARYNHGIKTELAGGGEAIVHAARCATPYLLRQHCWADASILLEQMLHRDQSPETLAYALPVLKRIADATTGTDREIIDAGLLAKTLSNAGRYQEAESLLREVIQRSAEQGQYRIASTAVGDLLNLLMEHGRLDAALGLAADKKRYTQAADLGPWTQLLDEAQRLQILNALGRYAEVLKALDTLRPQFSRLAEQSEQVEAVNPWNVRETLLDAGREAAMQSQQYEQALTLNAEIVQYTQQRGATALELAWTRFNDYGPLLRLKRYDQARQLLVQCRTVFETEHYIEGLGAVWNALADLADETGERQDAVRFEEIALVYKYQTGQPEDCAICHNNLALYLQRWGQDTVSVIAHRLAATTMALQMQSGSLASRLRNLARTELPATPPSFDQVVATVEQIEGVRFRALFERLPRTATDGDAAIATVWQMALAMKSSRSG